VAIGFALGGWMWHQFGTAAIIGGIAFTSPAFALNTLIYILSFIILWVGIHEVKEKRKESLRSLLSPMDTIQRYWGLVRNPLIAGFAPAWIAINAVLGIWINTTARILTDKISVTDQLLVGQFSSQDAGYVRTAYAVFFILGIVIWSVFFPNLKRVTAMLIGCGGLAVSCVLIFAINHQPSIDAPLTTVLAVLLVISIMVQSGFTPAALAYLADISETQRTDRGAIMGLYSIFLGLGQALGLVLGGPFIDFGGADGMALITGLLGVFAAFLVLRLRNVDLPTTSAAH
jgi:MFS family permease